MLFTDSILSSEKLLEGAKSFFNNDIWKIITKIQKDDLEDAIHCILVQSWTPAVMITMRVIESAFKSYYNKIMGREPTNTWYNSLHELENEPSADKNLIGYFNYLRDIRNRAQHPVERYTQFQAEEFFSHGIHILRTIYS